MKNQNVTRGVLLLLFPVMICGCSEDAKKHNEQDVTEDGNTTAHPDADNMTTTVSGDVTYKDGACVYACTWSEAECINGRTGTVTDGICKQGQVCCDVGEIPQVQCAGTCVMDWEGCSGGTIVTDGNCSDAQQICCDSNEDKYDLTEWEASLTDGGDAGSGSISDGNSASGSSSSDNSGNEVTSSDSSGSNATGSSSTSAGGTNSSGSTVADDPSVADVQIEFEVEAADKRVHYDNPFASTSKWYVNEWWSENAKVSGGEAIANVSTGVWMDRIAAIEAYDGQTPNENFGLREHLDAVLAQDADLFMFVVYDLPGRDCAALASNGELPATAAGMAEYKKEYIGRIVNILGEEKYAGITVVAIIEIDSLPNLVTNGDLSDCRQVDNSSPFGYTEGIRFALTQLKQLPNVHSYVDAAHSGWLGWDERFDEATRFIADVISGPQNPGPTAAPGWDSINGFITNTSNYTPLEEPYLGDPEAAGTDGQPLRSATFFDWNPVFGELQFARKWKDAMQRYGAGDDLGMLIDTGRNGWGGPDRPTAKSSATNLNEMVNASRIDRRPHRGSWCNQRGGIGERPQASPAAYVDAYVWVKPPGESDGVSTADFEIDPNDTNKKFDPMCGPNEENRYAEEADSTRGQGIGTGAMDNAPHAGRWFEEGFKVLIENAYPPL